MVHTASRAYRHLFFCAHVRWTGDLPPTHLELDRLKTPGTEYIAVVQYSGR